MNSITNNELASILDSAENLRKQSMQSRNYNIRNKLLEAANEGLTYTSFAEKCLTKEDVFALKELGYKVYRIVAPFNKKATYEVCW